MIWHGKNFRGFLNKAKEVLFDNTGTDLQSTNAEDAIKEVNGNLVNYYSKNHVSLTYVGYSSITANVATDIIDNVYDSLKNKPNSLATVKALIGNTDYFEGIAFCTNINDVIVYGQFSDNLYILRRSGTIHFNRYVALQAL